MELGEKQSGIKSLPLKFALFLLKDKNGDISLDLPLSGDLNDPDINIGKIVWTTFKNVIVKVASSPVDFLSGFANIDPSDIKIIEFSYLDTTLTKRIEHQLDMLIKLEQSKEELKIQMVYFNDVEKEKEAIAIRELGSDFFIATDRDYLKDELDFELFIKEKTTRDSVNISYDCIQLVGEQRLDSLYKDYSSKRIIKLESYLHLKNDSTLISITPYNFKAPKNKGSQPVFEMKYSIDE